MQEKKAREFLAFARRQAPFTIQTHDYPDPDAIGAAYGLYTLLRRQGLRSHIVYDGEINRTITQEMIKRLRIPIHSVAERRTSSRTRVLVVDGRVENNNVTRLPGHYVGAIDHHPGSLRGDGGQFLDIRPGYGATCSMIGEYFKALRVPLSRNEATALAIGLNSDTQRLLRDVSPADVAIYPHIFEKCDYGLLQYVMINNIVLPDLALFKVAINRLKTEGRLGFTTLPDMENRTLLAIIGDFLLTLKELDVVLAVAYNNDRLFLSARSESNNPTADEVILKTIFGFGKGGGHKSMAAGSVTLQAGMRITPLLATLRQRFFDLQD